MAISLESGDVFAFSASDLEDQAVREVRSSTPSLPVVDSKALEILHFAR